MRMKQFIWMAAAAAALVSCSPKIGYQVYEVRSHDLTQEKNAMVFENGDCKVSYNLWGNGGSMAFIFENKTDRDIFIDMTQSFFIKNGAAFDYYADRTYVTRSYAGLSAGYSVSGYARLYDYFSGVYRVPAVLSLKESAGLSRAVTVREPEYVCVPAKSHKIISVYEIDPSRIVTCEKPKDYPKTKAVVATYSEDNTPLRLNNRIAYSFEEDNKSLKHIDNTFWVSSVQNYRDKAILEKRKVNVGCYADVKKKIRYFKVKGPNLFYITYDWKNVMMFSE